MSVSVHNFIKEGNIHTFSIKQNTTTYVLRMAHCPKGLWVCIEESYSQWKLTITSDLIDQTVAKASGNQEKLSYKQFITALLGAVLIVGKPENSAHEKSEKKLPSPQSGPWTVGIMTPIELELLRGGNATKQAGSNKLYLILSNKQKKQLFSQPNFLYRLHYPFTLLMADHWEKDKLVEAIKKMKDQLEELRMEKADKSQSSFSVMSETYGQSEQLKYQNEQLKKRIKMYEQSLTQKRGAVEIDTILKEKNTLEIKVETKRREENKEITRLKNSYQLMDREINEITNEVDYINREMMLLEDSMSNPAKLKSHAMRVLKSYESDLRTAKKVIMKQNKEIENIKRNILNSKNTEKRHLAKIKQIQQEIEQAKKKANIKEISNRLHSNSAGSRQASSIASSSKAPSVVSSQGKAKSYTSSRSGGMSGNLVRQNLLKKTSDITPSSYHNRHTKNNDLMKTTPNIKTTPTAPRKGTTDYGYKPPTRPVASSHQISQQKPTASNRVSYTRNYSPAKSDKSSVRSAQSVEVKRKEFTPEERERQRAAMARLTGATNRQTGTASRNSSSKDKIGAVSSAQSKGSENRRNNVSSSLQNKPKFGQPSANSAKDVLKKMKEVKAYYNSKAIVSAQTNKQISEKIETATKQK